MTVILVHHADAVGPDVDPQRPLSTRGHAQAESLAAQARAAGLVPPVIWHSGKLRARQTAEWFLRLCNPFAAFKMVRGLRPEDAPEIMLDAVALEEGSIMLVSHMPLLPALARRLAPESAAFPQHGLVVVERLENGLYAETLRLKPEM